jgi:hypothetical protein
MDKRTRKESVKKLKIEAGKLWKLVVLRNNQGRCYVCGSRFMIDPHHFIPKRISLNLRYNPENGVALCRKCHNAITFKEDPMISLIIASKKGKNWVEYLEREKNKKVIPNKKWYKEQIMRLKKELLR